MEYLNETSLVYKLLKYLSYMKTAILAIPILE